MFKTWNQTNVTPASAHTEVPAIRISTYGLVAINSSAQAILGLKEHDRIVIVQGLESEAEFLIAKTKSETGIKLIKYPRYHGLFFKAMSLCREFWRITGKTGKIVIRMNIVPEALPKSSQELPAAAYRLQIIECKKS